MQSLQAKDEVKSMNAEGDVDAGGGNSRLTPDTRLRLNTPLVASQIIDGEAVLIHFESGSYYSAGRAGAEVLSLLVDGLTLGQIVADLGDRYTAPGDVEQDVRRFLDRLLEEGLVTPSPATDGETPDLSPLDGRGVVDEVPQLQKFSDLEDLLLLDPIHDADEAGWPVAKPDLDASEG